MARTAKACCAAQASISPYRQCIESIELGRALINAQPNDGGRQEVEAVTLKMTDLADFSATYFSSFNPADISMNYLADAGVTALTSSYSFNIDPGASFVVTVNGVTAGAPGAPYT